MVPDARRIADAAILKNLESLPEFAEASVIAAYASDGTEPDLMPLLRRAAGTGKTICLPRWLNDSNYEMAVLDGDFKTVSGKWNMPEPPPDAPPAETQLLERALWLVPGWRSMKTAPDSDAARGSMTGSSPEQKECPQGSFTTASRLPGCRPNRMTVRWTSS